MVAAKGRSSFKKVKYLSAISLATSQPLEFAWTGTILLVNFSECQVTLTLVDDLPVKWNFILQL